MKRLNVLLAILLTVVLSSPTVIAQTRKAGINGAAFLKIGVGARQVGLGSATTSLSGDVTNMYWNPAGIALGEEHSLQASFTYNKWFADLTQNAVAVSYKLEGVGTIGVGVMTFGVSDIPSDRDVYSDPLLQAQQIDQINDPTYDYMDLLAMVSFSRYVTDRLSLGASIKFIREAIDDQAATAVAFDLGSVYHIGVLNWSIGARITNLGSDLKFYDYASPIPLTFGIGTSFTPWSNESNNFTVSIDAVKPQDGQQFYYAGGEYTFMHMISLRGGYKLNYSGTDDGGASFRPAINTTIEGFTLGAGFRLPVEEYDLRLDYAFTKMDLLDNVHRVTIQYGMK